MGRQSDIFLKGEGKAWLKRNEIKINRDSDPILMALREAEIKPRDVFEVGCADGWRLAILREEYKCNANGVDPGSPERDPWVDDGTATRIDWDDASFDLLIYGFCLYLCDREDLFKIVAEGDRVLQNGGYLVIWDFHAEATFSVAYQHCDDVYAYHMDYAKLWLGNPAYSLYRRSIQADGTSVTILKKETRSAWPLEVPPWTF